MDGCNRQVDIQVIVCYNCIINSGGVIMKKYKPNLDRVLVVLILWYLVLLGQAKPVLVKWGVAFKKTSRLKVKEVS